MTDFSLKLSAYLDGELNAEDVAMVEARLATDPDAQAQFDALIQADADALDQFDALLSDPVPLSLAQQIKNAPLEAHPVAQSLSSAVTRRPLWGMIAASLAVFMLGGAGGYVLKGQTAPVQMASTWLTDIADYHAVYAKQGRHLVEVSADESDHIETWLGDTTGAQFTIPDLSQFDLTFQGGRLLVAGGKPVAQLMYTQADGTVIALCLQRNGTPETGTTPFKSQTLNGFDVVSWKTTQAAYVVLGPQGQSNIADIATAAALEI
jgi:anti-sigma factor RsiW